MLFYRVRQSATLFSAAFVLAALWCASPASAADFVRDGYYWYVPEHEKYGATQFFSEPNFQSTPVRIEKTQRFRYGSGWRGWVLLEFDSGVRVFVHSRIMLTLLYDPEAPDLWYEFKRASVFPEEPAKIEARLKPATTPTADTRVPIWKRYKESWSINKGRETDPERAAAAPEKKPRIRPLPPAAEPRPEVPTTEPLPEAR